MNIKKIYEKNERATTETYTAKSEQQEQQNNNKFYWKLENN